ncbi:hypothetical protein [Agaribacter flavus]|uniref:hypothetical protein n=1 Tax=Agaribacter flavus TaxID=1902781 RepID=UPI00366D9580
MCSVKASHAQSLQHKLDVQIRADERSDKDLRYQYRIRYSPSLKFNQTWSTHGFAATGDDFSSSHNTFDDGSADRFYLRRLFLRHQGNYGKTELGVIPTFKGRVSSSGLSKDGWIQGIRHVRDTNSNAQLEIVVGQLNKLNPRQALDTPNDIDYVELEYSASINDLFSYEFSMERMTSLNYLRTELRYRTKKSQHVFAELVKRANTTKVKTVLGIEGEKAYRNRDYAYFAHYSYVSGEFGLRAELTEDFLGTGHGFSAKLESQFTSLPFDWFVRFDKVGENNRILGGIKWSL